MAPPPPWGFVNPPDMLDEDWGKFAGNPQYPLDFVVNLVWRAPVGLPLSIRLYQVNLTSGDPYEDFDYILQSVVNRTEHEWRVSVDPQEQDLAVSNVFLLALYKEGDFDYVGTSQYFNISRRSTNDDSAGGSSTASRSAGPSTSAGLSTTRLNTATAVLSSPTDDTTRAPAASSSSSAAAAAAEGLPAAAKIGIAVAIPLAIILGLLAGWLLFRRRRQARDPLGPQPPPHYYAQYQHPALVPDPTKQQPPPLPGELPGTQTCEISVHNYGGHRYELDAPVYDRRARGGLG